MQAEHPHKAFTMYANMLLAARELRQADGITQYEEKANAIKSQLDGQGTAHGGLYIRKLNEAVHCMESGFLTSALAHFDALREAEGGDPLFTMTTDYYLGMLYFTQVADSASAATYFRQVAGRYENEEDPHVLAQCGSYFRDSCQNLMLLATSFDEYKAWAARLLTVTPEVTLPGQYENIRHAVEDKGQEWWRCAFLLATTYYNRSDPMLDTGLYGHAASIYDGILLHGQTLSLPANAQAEALYECSALTLRMTYTTLRGSRTAQRRGVPPEEYAFVLERALGRIEDYGSPDGGEQLEEIRLAILELLDINQ